MPIAAIIDDKIFAMHGGLSPDLQNMEQIRRIMRPTDIPDSGALTASSFGTHKLGNAFQPPKHAKKTNIGLSLHFTKHLLLTSSP
jgi:hypothetical protein